jgi:hypothetical protein
MIIIRVILAIPLLLAALVVNSQAASILLESGGFQTVASVYQNSPTAESMYSSNYNSFSFATIPSGGYPWATSGYASYPSVNEPYQPVPGMILSFRSQTFAGVGTEYSVSNAFSGQYTYDPISLTNYQYYQVVHTSGDKCGQGYFILNASSGYSPNAEGEFGRYTAWIPNIIVTVNGMTVLSMPIYPTGSGASVSNSMAFPVNIGDVIGISAALYTSSILDQVDPPYWEANVDAFLQVGLVTRDFTPLPSTVLLLGSGLLGLAGWRRLKKS